MENGNVKKKEIFHILGIEETIEEDRITEAYRERLKVTHPEDDPAEFQLLRRAYEEAIYYARHPEEEGEHKQKTKVDEWICKVEEVYTDIIKRGSVEEWERIFSDSICDGLDTFIEAREKILLFFANNIYTPQFVWKMADKTFCIRESYKELIEQFPADYLHYVIEHIENDTFIDYTLFTYTVDEKEKARPDEFIDAYFKCKNQLDEKEPEEVKAALCKLKEYGVYHPFVEAEWIRYFLKINELAKARKVAGKLEEMNLQNHYIKYYIAEVYAAVGEEEKAFAIWQEILEKYPGYYEVMVKMADYYLKRNMYYEASELLQVVCQNVEENEELNEKIKVANEKMIKELKAKVENEEEDERFPRNKLKLNLAYYLWQTGKTEEALAIMYGFEPEQNEIYTYTKFIGILLSDKQEEERALSYHQKALEILLEKKTKEEKDYQDLGQAYYRLGECYTNLNKIDEACKIFLQGTESLEDVKERHLCMERLANLYDEEKEYEKVVDICDEILREDSGYYSAYMYRQKAFYMLDKLQESIDDFLKAIQIYAGFYQPYQYALEIFVNQRLLEEAGKVLKLVKENDIFSPRISILESRYYRFMLEEDRNCDESIAVLQSLVDKIDEWRKEGDERADYITVEDLAEISYEFSLIEESQENYEKALEHIQMALKYCPENSSYHIVCGICYQNLQEYENGILELKKAAKDYDDTPVYYYNLGLCYEGLDEIEEAVGYFKKTLEHEKCYKDACEKLSDHYRDLFEDTCKKEYLELAIEYIDQELEETESVYYLIARGLLYLNNLYLPDAKRDFLRAEELRQGDWYIECQLGFCERYAGNYETAISYFRKAIACMKAENKSHHYPYQYLITSYEIIQDFKSVEKVCKEAIEAFPEILSFWENLGDAYKIMGEHEKALEAFEHLEKKGNYYYAIADLELSLGNMEKWKKYNEKALEIAEDKQQAYYDYGIDCMFGAKDYASAVPILKNSFLLTKDYDDKAICLIDIATCYYMLAEDEKAFEYAKEAKKYYELYFEQKGCTEEEYMTYPRAKAARIANKGWMLLCLGEREEAVRIFVDMFKMQKCRRCGYKACFESRLYLARVYEREGDIKKAMEFYEETLQINVSNYESKKALELLSTMNNK